MKEFSKGQKMTFWYLIMCLIGLPICKLLGDKFQEENQHIETNGKTGICIVTNHQIAGRRTEATKFYVHYEYMVDSVVYHRSQDFYNYDFYGYAIIGMKYEIKYLEDNPKKSLIHLDKPIETEYKNIEKERQRMKESNSSRYKRGLESAVPIETIKMWYPQYFESE